MRVVKADDVFSAFASLPLDANQFTRIDVVTILRRVSARVAASHNRTHAAHVPVHPPEQDPTALVGIGFLAVAANLVKVTAAHLQHKNFTTETQRQRRRNKKNFSVTLW